MKSEKTCPDFQASSSSLPSITGAFWMTVAVPVRTVVAAVAAMIWPEAVSAARSRNAESANVFGMLTGRCSREWGMADQVITLPLSEEPRSRGNGVRPH